VKVLVLGIGSMGLNHVKTLAQLKREGLVTEIYAVDIDKQRLNLAKNQGADLVFTNVNEVLQYKPELGIIAVPTNQHYETAKSLINHMDLLVEKPIAEKLSEALDLYRKARELGRKIFVGHIERFNPAYNALINEINNEEPTYVESIRIGLLKGDPSKYGNVLLDLGIHDIDLVLNIINEDEVRIMGKILRGDPIRTAWVMLEIGNIPYILHASWDYETRVRRLTILMKDRYYDTDLLNKFLYRNGTKHIIEGEDQLRRELVHVINALRGVERPIIDIADGIRALAVINAILTDQQIINLNEILK